MKDMILGVTMTKQKFNHYTIPYEFDKFWTVCKECHYLIHKEEQCISGKTVLVTN